MKCFNGFDIHFIHGPVDLLSIIATFFINMFTRHTIPPGDNVKHARKHYAHPCSGLLPKGTKNAKWHLSKLPAYDSSRDLSEGQIYLFGKRNSLFQLHKAGGNSQEIPERQYLCPENGQNNLVSNVFSVFLREELISWIPLTSGGPLSGC